ncbi:MAG: ABC transporter ATP-binding protein, partial [Candidatus Brocadiia bacterium]
MTPETLLRIEDLHLHYRSREGIVRAVDGVSMDLASGRAMAVLGESGCGKSSLTRAILRLLPENVERYDGRMMMGGQDLMSLGDERFRRQVRWMRIALVAQAAMNALNPVVRVGKQVGEPLRTHTDMSRGDVERRVRQSFRELDVPVDFLQRYPFELSGGMRQRAIIAMALVADPDLILLDEPTSALDLLTQANIMNSLKRIKEERNTGFVFITHDVGTASELADDVAVMYAGQMVEVCSAEEFFSHQLHPYSEKLMASVPRLEGDSELEFIPGRPPSLFDPPPGCRFAPRCDRCFEKCKEPPPVFTVSGGRRVRCWLFDAKGEREQEAVD